MSSLYTPSFIILLREFNPFWQSLLLLTCLTFIFCACHGFIMTFGKYLPQYGVTSSSVIMPILLTLMVLIGMLSDGYDQTILSFLQNFYIWWFVIDIETVPFSHCIAYRHTTYNLCNFTSLLCVMLSCSRCICKFCVLIVLSLLLWKCNSLFDCIAPCCS